MKVFHGSNMIVDKPDVMHSYRALDFGKGFYVTTVWEQAERWAKRKAQMMESGKPIVNIYEMSEEITERYSLKTFPDDLDEWIDFVCRCRDEYDDYVKYDVIKGKVANDQVFRVVSMYHRGVWDKERALKEIKAYPGYDQIAFINQDAIDELLTFDSYREV